MGETRRKYTREFKIETVRLFELSGKSAQEIEEVIKATLGDSNCRRLYYAEIT